MPFCNLLRNLEKITLKTKLYSCTGVLCVLELLKWPVKSTAGWTGQSCLFRVCQKPWNLNTCNRWARSLTLCRHARVFEYARLSTELPACWVHIYLNSGFLRGSCTWCGDIDFQSFWAENIGDVIAHKEAFVCFEILAQNFKSAWKATKRKELWYVRTVLDNLYTIRRPRTAQRKLSFPILIHFKFNSYHLTVPANSLHVSSCNWKCQCALKGLTRTLTVLNFL